MTPTFTKDDGTAQKNIYHSHLVRLCQGDWKTVQLLGPPRESKYPKGNLTHHVYLQVQGDEQEYSLAIEPETLPLLEKAPTKVWLHIRAEGSATTPASLEFSQAEGHSVVHDPEEGKPQDGPPEMWPEGEPVAPQPPVAGPMGGDAVARAVEGAVRALNGMKAAGYDVPPESWGAVFSTLYIQESRR